MKSILISTGIFLFFQSSMAQGKYLTNEGVITFYSHTVIEDITARNEKVAAVVDSENGELAIIVVMNEFQFEKKLMQEHFNENYVESEKYPKARFNGRISNNSEVDYRRSGTYQVRVDGDLSIHGITRKVSVEGSIEVGEEGITAKTKFLLNPEDYAVRIPRVVRKNISKSLEITAELSCFPL